MASYKGFDEKVLTFKDGGATEGYPVCINSDSSVHDGGSSAEFIGICSKKVSDDYVTVQVSGYIELSYTGSTPSAGYAAFVADGNGGVRVLSSGRVLYKVVSVDTDKKTIGIIL